MSPQPSRIGGSTLEVSEVGDELVFGEDVESSLAIPKALLTQIWTEVDEGRRALSRGGLEVGGLLVGPKESPAGRVLVDGIIPLRIDYQRGPSFQMSASDLRKIAPAMESEQEDPSKAVVGFYRSRTRGDSSLRESDYEIFQAIEDAHPSFGTDFRCCFIVAPVSESLSLACVRMRRGGDWGEVQQFTLRSQHVQMTALPSSTALEQSPRNPRPVALPIRTAVAIVPAVPEHSEPEQHVAEPVVTPVVTPRPQGTRRGGMWLLAVALAAVFTVGGAVAAFRWVTAIRVAAVVPAAVKQTEAARPHLGFSAAQEGGVWKLSWDRAAMDALNPVGAVLSIDEGGAEEQVPLQPSDLASGILFYTSHSSDLNFGLRVDLGGNHVEERIRVLEGPKIAQRSVFPAAVSTTPPVASVSPKPLVNSTPVANAQPPANSKPAAGSNADTSFTAASLAPPAPRKFTIASKLDRGGSVAPIPIAVPDSNVVALAVPVPPPIEPRTNREIGAAPPRVTPPAAPTPTPEPAAAGQTVAGASARSASTAPLTPATIPPLKANYSGPRPISQVTPRAANAPAGSQVQVLVEIDARGKVTKARPVGWTPTNAPLMILAVRAASSWVFDPAKLDGRAVPSQMTLIFKF